MDKFLKFLIRQLVKNRKWVYAALLSVVLFSCILIAPGTISSGYHLQDDHLVMQMEAGIKHGGVISSAISTVKSDLKYRFRPLYDVLLVIKIYFLGVDMNRWMMVSFIEGVLTFIFLFVFAVNIGGNYVSASLFSILCIFGWQITPWYRACNQENTGTFLLSIVLLLLSWGYYVTVDDRICKTKWTRYGIIIVMVLCSLQKESYVIILPSIICLILEFGSVKEEYAGKGRPGLKRTVVRNLDYIVILSVSFFVEIGVIVGYTGTNSIGYAGFGGDSRLGDYIHGVIVSLNGGLRYYMALSVIGILFIVLEACFDRKEFSMLMQGFGQHLWLCLAIITGIGGEMALYAKSTMWGRYMLPCVIIIAGFVVFVIRKNLKGKYSYLFYTILCIVVCILGLKQAHNESQAYARIGREVRAYHETALSTLKNDMDGIGNILIDTGTLEFTDSTVVWLNYYMERELPFVALSDGVPDQEYEYIFVPNNVYYDTDYIFEKIGKPRDEYTAIDIQNAYVVSIRKDEIE